MVIKPPSTPLLHLRHAREAFHFVARTLEATDESRYRRVLRRIERICNRLRKYCLIFKCAEHRRKRSYSSAAAMNSIITCVRAESSEHCRTYISERTEVNLHYPSVLCVLFCKLADKRASVYSCRFRIDFFTRNSTTENYIRYLSDRIAFLNSKIAGLSAGDSVHKLAQWLLEHASGGAAPLPPMTRLANELNLGRASLYRAMDTLEVSGAIRREGKTVLLCSPNQLRGMDDGAV